MLLKLKGRLVRVSRCLPWNNLAKILPARRTRNVSWILGTVCRPTHSTKYSWNFCCLLSCFLLSEMFRIPATGHSIPVLGRKCLPKPNADRVASLSLYWKVQQRQLRFAPSRTTVKKTQGGNTHIIFCQVEWADEATAVRQDGLWRPRHPSMADRILIDE